MSRSPRDRLEDILGAIERTLTYRSRLADPDPTVASMAYDAVLRNLAVIGEAVRGVPEDLKRQAPGVAWASIAGLRNAVVHEYFRVDRSIIEDVLDTELVALRAAVRALVTSGA